jgi:hypothetical protein
MSKKAISLALAAAWVVMAALPAAASAQEIHIDGFTSFTGTFGKRELTFTTLPVTCAQNGVNHVSGSFNPGSTTTGTIEYDLTECHTINSFFGITQPCHSPGSPLNNTIRTTATFHTITVNNKPGFLITMAENTIECPGATFNIAGSVIGTITSPKCDAESKSITVKFNATGTSQEDKTYTGVDYHLTNNGTEVGLIEEVTFQSATAGKLTCT